MTLKTLAGRCLQGNGFPAPLGTALNGTCRFFKRQNYKKLGVVRSRRADPKVNQAKLNAVFTESNMITMLKPPSTFNTEHIWFTGTNRLEDVDIYAFDPPAPADVGTLNNVAVNSTDEVLKGLLRADTTKLPRCIAGWEDHRANLPEDPSQASHIWCTGDVA